MWPSSHGCQAKVISQEDFGNFLEKSKTHLVFVKNLPEDGESSLDGFFFPSACCYSESGHWRWRWHQTHGEKHQKSHETWQMSWYPLVPSLIVDSLELWCWGSVLIPLMAGTGRGVGRLLRLPKHVVCRGLQWLKRPITKQLVPVWCLGQWHSWSNSCSIEIWLCNMQCEERVLSYDSKAFQVVPFNRIHGLTNQHVVDSGSLQHTTQWWCNDGRAYYGIPARDTLRNSTHQIWSRV